jgi:hypothetical protein
MALQRLRSSDDQLNRVQDNIAKALGELEQRIGMKFVLAQGIELLGSSTDNIVNHKLGRAAQGFLVSNRNANAVVWVSPTLNKSPERQIILRAGSNVTVDLLFF